MFFYPLLFYHSLGRLFDDLEFACSDTDPETPHDQEYFQHVAKL